MKAINPFVFRIVVVLLLVAGAAISYAELPSRSEQLKNRYQLDRAKGLKTLSERYLELYSAEMKRVLAAGELEEANTIKTKIETLREEVELMSAVMSGDSDAGPGDAQSLLEGVTIFFRHDRHPDPDSSYVFKKDGEAIWAEAGDASVPRQYKATEKPRQFLLWWLGHDLQPVWEITVAADGKTAMLRNTSNDYTAEGRIEKTR